MLQLTFAVKQNNTAALFELLDKTSDPDSPIYGHHATLTEVSAMVAPLGKSVEAVLAFLRHNGAEGACATPNCDFVTSTVSVAKAGLLLGTTYEEYVHTPTGLRLWATEGYSLPSSVADHVDFVSPTTRLPSVAKPIAQGTSRRLLGG